VSRLFCLSSYVRAEPPLSPSFHPQSVMSDFSLAARWAYPIQSVLRSNNRPRLLSRRRELGPGVRRSHRISAVELDCQDPTLRCGAFHFVVVPQWFINFPTHPQLVQQYGQLARYANDGSLLGILSSSLG
jgi:hypothetical protein